MTITLTCEQANSVDGISERLQAVVNKVIFLQELAEQQFDNGYEFSSGAWLGLSELLKDMNTDLARAG